MGPVFLSTSLFVLYRNMLCAHANTSGPEHGPVIRPAPYSRFQPATVKAVLCGKARGRAFAKKAATQEALGTGGVWEGGWLRRIPA